MGDGLRCSTALDLPSLVETIPSVPKGDGSTGDGATEVVQVDVEVCVWNEDAESVLVPIVTPDVPGKGLRGDNEGGTIGEVPARAQVESRGDGLNVPGATSPDERPELVLSAVVGITNDGFVIDTREINNSTGFDIGDLVCLARNDLNLTWGGHG